MASQVLTDGDDSPPSITSGSVYALDGSDRIFVNATTFGLYSIYGGEGSDFVGMQADIPVAYFYGGGGADTLHGGKAYDHIYGDNEDDLLVGGEFSYTTFSSAGVIEAFNSEPSGNDTLDGGEGNDALYGLDGNDNLYGGDDDESGPINVRNSSGGVSVVTAGLFGGDGEDYLDGGRGNDYLDGGTGNDRLIGGDGNDVMLVDTASDKVVEAADAEGGIDTVRASATYALATGVAVERLETTLATGTNAFNLVGNEFAQTITGNDGANVLGGGGGNDVISARGGADAVQGGLGNDTLAGNGGNDGFYFSTALNAATNVDRILDFGQASGNADLIRLDNAIFTTLGAAGFLDPDFFKANATGTASDGNDHIVYETDTGKLFYDTNGNTAGGATQFATLTNFASLTGANAVTAADFYVY